MARRYLTAFGPASVADLQRWSGLTRKDEGRRLTAALEALDLDHFTDESGRDLVDLPDAPRPDPGTPAPLRFLPAFDNLMVGHDDRTRVMADEHRKRVITGSLVRAAFLVDGFVAGLWEVRADGDSVVLTLEAFEAETERSAELREEAARLVEFAVPGARSEIRFGAVAR